MNQGVPYTARAPMAEDVAIDDNFVSVYEDFLVRECNCKLEYASNHFNNSLQKHR